MQLVIGTSEDEKGRIIGYWMSQMMKKPMHPPYAAMGWLNQKDSLVGAALFNGYNGANIEMHIYGPGAMTRQSVREVFRYVFGQLGCTRLTANVPRRNARLRKLMGKPTRGFSFEATLARFYGPTRADDGMLYRIDRNAAERWMK